MKAALVLASLLASVSQAAAAGHTVYLNRCADGCTVTPGADNSSADTSSIVSEVGTLSAFAGSDESWDATMACVRFMLAPYDVEVTDVDPGQSEHFEVMVAGLSSDLGMDPTYVGNSPARCDVIERGLSFTFANDPSLVDQPIDTCSVVGFGLGVILGLSDLQQAEEPDVMSSWFVVDGQVRVYQDTDIACNCSCGSTSQNSHQHLLDVLGPADPPYERTAVITSPADGAVVEPSFSVTADIDGFFGSVELRANGISFEPLTEAPFTWEAAVGLTEDEPFTIELTANDARGSISHSITVSPAGSGDDVDDGGASGGCAAGGQGAGLSSAFLVLALAGGRRRRRRSAPARRDRAG